MANPILQIEPDLQVDVTLPADADREDTDQFEIVTVNGVNYQLSLGVPVKVPYMVFEALYNSGRYERL